MSRGGGGLGFLTDRAQLVRRFVLAEILGPPRGRVPRGMHRVTPVAPPQPPTPLKPLRPLKK